QPLAAGSPKPEEFQENQSQSSLLGHIFRKHVKPKKQHEIRKLGTGHLTRFLSFGLGLSVTAIEADRTLVSMASRFDGQLLWALEKEKQKVGALLSFLHHPVPSEFGYPMSSWVRGLSGHQLSYKAREGACHAVEDYIRRLREESELLRTHCYRAMLETFIRDTRPDLRRAGIQTIKKAHLLPFTE
uniref:Methyltransferase like 25B n=1 Tax=Lates calcarifer TaxID=8187 RepID=A0A4W6D454_LATCA